MTTASSPAISSDLDRPIAQHRAAYADLYSSPNVEGSAEWRSADAAHGDALDELAAYRPLTVDGAERKFACLFEGGGVWDGFAAERPDIFGRPAA